jgi:hypothetical protein
VFRLRNLVYWIWQNATAPLRLETNSTAKLKNEITYTYILSTGMEICYPRVTNRRFFHAFLLFITKSIAPIFVRWTRADSPAPASISSLVYLPKFPLGFGQPPLFPNSANQSMLSPWCSLLFQPLPPCTLFVSKSSTAVNGYFNSVLTTI